MCWRSVTHIIINYENSALHFINALYYYFFIIIKKIFFTAFSAVSLVLSSTLSVHAERCHNNEYLYGYGVYVSNCDFPQGGGIFQNDAWEVVVLSYEAELSYRGKNRNTGASIILNKAIVSGTKERSQFIFRNGDVRYIVTIRPSDPNVIRLEVYQGNQILLNQLLSRIGGYTDALNTGIGY